MNCFNPRLYKESERIRIIGVRLSIHAPTLGATEYFSELIVQLCFNPRPYSGRSSGLGNAAALTFVFRSTLQAGVIKVTFNIHHIGFA